MTAFFGIRYRERIYYSLTGRHTAAYEGLLTGPDSAGVSFISCGNADSALIQAGGSTVLIDAGDYDNVQKVMDYLEAQQILKIDYLILTHPHGDHYGAADDVIRKYPVDCVLITHVPDHLREDSAGWDYVLRTAEKFGAEIRNAEAGEILALDKGEIRILWAGSDECEDINACSIVCRYVYGERAFLFTGDAEESTERRILAAGVELRSDVLKAGHHGSWDSCCKDFLASVRPSYVVASCSADNRFGFPKETFQQRVKDAGADLLVTYRNGTVEFVTDGKELVLVY